MPPPTGNRILGSFMEKFNRYGGTTKKGNGNKAYTPPVEKSEKKGMEQQAGSSGSGSKGHSGDEELNIEPIVDVAGVSESSTHADTNGQGREEEEVNEETSGANGKERGKSTKSGTVVSGIVS